MYRKIMSFLEAWKENKHRKPLVLQGARQVGKTYSILESERGAEIDFVIQRDGKRIPIEVKSADNTKAKSLKVYMETYKPAYAIKLSAKNFGFADKKKIVPLYAAFCI